MIKVFKDLIVKEYNSEYRARVENFRQQTFQEGNDSLSYEKYNPDNLQGQTWLTFIDDELASISVCEASHYTGDPEIAVRICRYHILKKFRHCNAGFHMLPYQVEWAIENKFKVIFWTHSTQNKTLTKLYNQEGVMPGKQHFFQTKLYKSFKRKEDILFQVSSKSKLLQYIYYKLLDSEYYWLPKNNIVPMASNTVDS